MVESMSLNQVSSHNKPGDCWVSYKGKIIDISSFAEQHPGGSQILEPYYGGDISEAFHYEADHSDAALQILLSLQIGKRSSKQLVDPKKGLIYQVWSTLSLSEYKILVSNPQHVQGHIRIFDNPFLQFFTKTPWYIPALVWLPIAMVYIYRSLSNQAQLYYILIGLMGWTLLQYILHRFFFHCEDKLPNNRYLYTFHFLMHGVHHAFPMDSLRLVFPPAMSLILEILVKCLINIFFPLNQADGIMAGILIGYVWYDTFHYYIHHGRPTASYFNFMKIYHMKHHFLENADGFGVSQNFWDIVFNTQISVEKA